MTKVDNSDFRKNYKEHLKYVSEHPEMASMFIEVDGTDNCNYFKSLITPKNNAEIQAINKTYEIYDLSLKIMKAASENRLPAIEPEDNEGFKVIIDLCKKLLNGNSLESVINGLKFDGKEYANILYCSYIGLIRSHSETVEYVREQLGINEDNIDNISKLLINVTAAVQNLKDIKKSNLSEASQEDLDMADEVINELKRLYSENLLPEEDLLSIFREVAKKVLEDAREDMQKRNNPLIDDKFILDNKIEDDSYKFPSR